MTSSRPTFRQRALAAALAFTFAAGPAVAAPPPWQDAAFSYYAENKPLDAVLREFASAFSLSTDLPAGLQGTVNGRFTYRSPTEFIDRLGSTFGFNWFTHAGVLFVSRSQDLVVRSIPTSAAGPGTNLRQMLTDLRVLDPRFGWGELPEQGVVVVSGPPAYVRLIESTIQSLPSTPGGQQVAVFRFKHASVEDRTIMYRDKEITTPGVATIIRNLVLGPSSSTSARATTGALAAAGITNNPFMATTPEAGRAPAAQATAPAQGNIPVPPANPSRLRPSVQADPRLNAVIVQDTPERMPIYERLVAQLDVPTPLIEIEAMIIDVNTTRLAELGVAWNYAGRDRSVALGYGDISTAVTANTLSIASGAQGQINPTTILPNAGNFFIARLRALEQEGDASIQARPSILTTENLGAILDLSETFYIQTTSERTALVTPVTAGTTLRVTPRLVNPGGDQQTVKLTVDIEDGQIQQENTVGGVPTVRRGTVSTEASVRLDESLLIGGYNSVQTVNSRDRVPFFGDLPVLGALFSARSQKLQRRERLFLIRTNVIGTVSPLSGDVAAAGPVGAAAGFTTRALEQVTSMPPSAALAVAKELSGQSARLVPPGPSAVFTPATQPPTPVAERKAPAAEATVVAALRQELRVDPAVQRSRDRDARRILEEELKIEADALARLEQDSAQGRADAAAERRIRAHRYNMDQIRKELARLRE